MEGPLLLSLQYWTPAQLDASSGLLISCMFGLSIGPLWFSPNAAHDLKKSLRSRAACGISGLM